MRVERIYEIGAIKLSATHLQLARARSAAERTSWDRGGLAGVADPERLVGLFGEAIVAGRVSEPKCA